MKEKGSVTENRKTQHNRGWKEVLEALGIVWESCKYVWVCLYNKKGSAIGKTTMKKGIEMFMYMCKTWGVDWGSMSGAAARTGDLTKK